MTGARLTRLKWRRVEALWATRFECRKRETGNGARRSGSEIGDDQDARSLSPSPPTAGRVRSMASTFSRRSSCSALASVARPRCKAPVSISVSLDVVLPDPTASHTPGFGAFHVALEASASFFVSLAKTLTSVGCRLDDCTPRAVARGCLPRQSSNQQAIASLELATSSALTRWHTDYQIEQLHRAVQCTRISGSRDDSDSRNARCG